MLRELVYRLYQRRLESAVRTLSLPQHVGVILDGNRRFARKKGLTSIDAGHRAGADKAEEVLAWCDDLGIPVVTVWALSTDNFKREPEELAGIFAIVEEKVTALAESQGKSKGRRIRAVGRQREDRRLLSGFVGPDWRAKT